MMKDLREWKHRMEVADLKNILHFALQGGNTMVTILGVVQSDQYHKHHRSLQALQRKTTNIGKKNQ